METDPFFNALATLAPIVLLALMGVVAIYSVVGVPLGIILLAVALGMTVSIVWKHHHQAPHH